LVEGVLPSSGGEYVYLTRAYGPTWGFMSGWVSFFAGFSAPIAVAALAFANYLGHVCQACAEGKPHILIGSGNWTLAFGKQQMFASGLVVLLTILNVVGVQRSARVQNTLTGLKVAMLVTFIALAFTFGHGNWQNFSMHAVRTSTNPVPAQFAISLFYIYLSYSGWNAATYVAEELRQPSRTLPIALAVGTTLVAALYVVLNVVFIYAAPLESLKGEVAVGALAASRLFGSNIGGFFAALMALSLSPTFLRIFGTPMLMKSVPAVGRSSGRRVRRRHHRRNPEGYRLAAAFRARLHQRHARQEAEAESGI
jgi:APA family basic amino acid/polyamine antiporter